MGCLAGQHCVPVLRSGKSSFESYVPSIGWLYADKAVWGGELWSKELCWVFLQKDNKINKAEILLYNVLYICQGLPQAIITIDYPHNRFGDRHSIHLRAQGQYFKRRKRCGQQRGWNWGYDKDSSINCLFHHMPAERKTSEKVTDTD